MYGCHRIIEPRYLCILTGSVCTDPGTPHDGTQVATSYEPGQTVLFNCNNPGHTPDYKVVICQRFGNTGMYGWFAYNPLSRRVGDAVRTPAGGRRPVCFSKQPYFIVLDILCFRFFFFVVVLEYVKTLSKILKFYENCADLAPDVAVFVLPLF